VHYDSIEIQDPLTAQDDKDVAHNRDKGVAHNRDKDVAHNLIIMVAATGALIMVRRPSTQ
jgi:hypothetical protein